MACDCKDPVAKNSQLDAMTNGIARRFVKYCVANVCTQSEALERLERGTLTRANSKTVAFRVPRAQLDAIRRFSASRRMTVGQFGRVALRILANAAAGGLDAQAAIAALAEIFGLPPGATPDDV